MFLRLSFVSDKGNKYDLIKGRMIASAIGQIISLQRVFGKVVWFRTSELCGCILSKASGR